MEVNYGDFYMILMLDKWRRTQVHTHGRLYKKLSEPLVTRDWHKNWKNTDQKMNKIIYN